MSSILLLRGKNLRPKHPESPTSPTASPSRVRRRRSSVLPSPTTFFKGSRVIGWDVGSKGSKVSVTLDLSTFTVLLDGIPVRDAQYRFLKPQCGEKQGLLRISFAATLEPHSHPRVFELKAAIHSDFRLDTEILLSEATTPLKLVNLTNLGLSFDNWVLSTSALL
ncbi:hypothetical protein ECG_01779 [Echinococcus granulosus]|uniref:Uncharacterized protein n=1 Tax=Echinococcus granulosus TaxID=6210 RepID=W6U8M2_ECHGR|nr:hypothetical protein EGR_07504 [Echinococcus granulosus]EUB57628.1 hypothetical protein EGR_07504 [Echinococcus granulosus]KAH9287407.1 hypothetical protein ECG_01779 [Echinococcus granulosus]